MIFVGVLPEFMIYVYAGNIISILLENVWMNRYGVIVMERGNKDLELRDSLRILWSGDMAIVISFNLVFEDNSTHSPAFFTC